MDEEQDSAFAATGGSNPTSDNEETTSSGATNGNEKEMDPDAFN